MKISTLFTYSLNKPTEYVTDFDQRIEMIICNYYIANTKSNKLQQVKLVFDLSNKFVKSQVGILEVVKRY